MRGWRIRRRWPPPPCVESEEESLAHEVRDNTTVEDYKSGDEAQSRGTIDQYPLIVDVDLPGNKSKPLDVSFDQSSIASQSSDESAGPPTPPNGPSLMQQQHHSAYKRAIHHQEPPRRQEVETCHEKKQEPERKTRGRPGLSPIDTQIDGDIKNMLTGQRRAPSPYRMVKPEKEDLSTTRGRFSGEFLLSPEQTSLGTGAKAPDERKPVLNQPSNERRADFSSSDDSDRRRHHHRRRSTRGDVPLSGRSAGRPAVIHQDVRPVSRTHSYTYVDNDSFGSASQDDFQKSKREEHSDSERRSTITRSSYGSSLEDSKINRNGVNRANDKRSSMTASSSFVNSPRAMTNGIDPWVSGGSSDEGRRRKRDDISDSERRYSRMSTSFASSGDENKPQRRDRSRAPENPVSSRDVRPDATQRHSTLELPQISSSRHRDRSRTRDRSSTRTSRPTIDTLIAGASVVSSPVNEQYGDQHRSRLESEVSRYDYGADRYSHRSSTATPISSVSNSQIWGKALDDNENRHHSSGSSVRTSPHGTPSESTRVSKAPGDYFPLVNPVTSPQVAPPKLRTVSHNGVADDTKVPSRTNLMRPPTLPHSSRSSSDVPKLAQFTTRQEIRPRLSSTVQPIIEQRTRPPSVSTTVSPLNSPRVLQRAFSYSPTDDSRRDGYGRYRERNVSTLPATQRERLIHSAQASRDQIPRLSDFQTSLLNLPDCPRHLPSTGYHDWYTISGIENVKLCPMCVRVVEASPFRKLLVAVQINNPTKPMTCSMSQPWFKLGWIQTIKQRIPNTGLLRELVEIPTHTNPCPGTKPEVRSWFSLYDPVTDKPSNNFDVCSACVRSVRAIFPKCHDVFARKSKDMVQERFCDLNCHSKRFNHYIDLLEEISLKYDPKLHSRPPTKGLIEYVHKATRTIECTRSTPVSNKLWHFIPQLPELTICPECFDEVVWPMRDRPIADLVTHTMEIVPGKSRQDYVSCQLYSERSRRIFKEAVYKQDFQLLKDHVIRRHSVIQLLNEKTALVAKEIEQGIDKQAELEMLENQWKKFE